MDGFAIFPGDDDQEQHTGVGRIADCTNRNVAACEFSEFSDTVNRDTSRGFVHAQELGDNNSLFSADIVCRLGEVSTRGPFFWAAPALCGSRPLAEFRCHNNYIQMSQRCAPALVRESVFCPKPESTWAKHEVADTRPPLH